MPACPFCAEKIASGLSVCPHCGSNLGKMPPRAGTPGAGSGPRGGAKSGGGSGVSIVLIVVGVCFAVVLVCGGILAALMIPAVGQARTAARAAQSSNNLKQIGLAFHNYYDTHQVLPPGGTFDESERGHHSWGTFLLPYIEMGHVYGQIDFNQPWDDAANDSTMRNLVPTYRSPFVEGQMVDGRGFGLSHYAGNQEFLLRNGAMTFSDVADGLSNTVLAGEAAGDFKAWGDPTNVRDLTQGLNKGNQTFGRPGSQDCILLLGDGSVRRMNSNASPELLKALSSPKGGEEVPFDPSY